MATVILLLLPETMGEHMPQEIGGDNNRESGLRHSMLRCMNLGEIEAETAAEII